MDRLKRLRFLGRTLRVRFPHYFSDGNSKSQGLADPDAAEMKIAAFMEDGRKLPWHKVLHNWFHELSHICDEVTRHDLFTDDDEEIDAIKENQLDAFWNILLPVMLENKILNPEFIKELQDRLKEL